MLTNVAVGIYCIIIALILFTMKNKIIKLIPRTSDSDYTDNERKKRIIIGSIFIYIAGIILILNN
jgi:hypothetical protein